MTTKNKYIRRSKISEAKFREIIQYFAIDLSASQIAILTKISRPTINKILQKIREKIAEKCEKQAKLAGDIKLFWTEVSRGAVRQRKFPSLFY